MQAHRSLEACNTAVVLTAPAATAPARQCETSSCMMQYARQHPPNKLNQTLRRYSAGRHLSGMDSTLAGLAGQQRMCPSVQRSPPRCRCEQVGHRPESGSCLPRDKPRSCFQCRQLSLQQPLAGRHDEGRGPHRRLATQHGSESAVLQLLKNEEGANVAMFKYGLAALAASVVAASVFKIKSYQHAKEELCKLHRPAMQSMQRHS